MRFKAFYALASGASLFAIASLGGVAHAQNSQEATAADGGIDIVVTARRRDERLQDVPTSIRAVTSDMLNNLNIRDFKDVQSVVPGLQLNSSPGGFTSSATLRGIKFDVDSGGSNPSVEFYLNDAPIASNILFGAMYDIGQIEVLRGPQGTLRGRASPSGSIAITTHRPNLEEYGGYVTGTVTSLSGFNVNGAVNVPVLKDVLALRFAGYTEKSELNRVYSISNSLNPRGRTDSYRISARFEPTDFLAINASYQRVDRKTRLFDQAASASLYDPTKVGGTLIRPDDRLGITDGYNALGQKFDQLNWSADLRFAGQKLSYAGSHNVQRNNQVSVQDFANAITGTSPRVIRDPNGFPQVCTSNAAYLGYQAITGEPEYCIAGRSVQDSNELRLQSEERVLGMLGYVIGGFVNHYNTPTNITRETAISLPAALGGGYTFEPTNIGRTGRSTERSVFGNLTAYFGDKTELSGGLRYISYKTEDGLTVGGVPLRYNKESFSTTIYAATLKHNFSDDVMAYANVGTSWRPGIRLVGDFSVNQTDLERSFQNTNPEKSTSYEVGVKTAFLNRRLQLNISAFHQDFKNYAYRSVNALPFIRYDSPTATSVDFLNFIAAVPVKVDGVEVEASFEATKRWTIGVNFSYANGRITGGTIPCLDLNRDGIPDRNPGTVQLSDLPADTHIAGCNFTGSANTAPKWNATIQSEYSHNISGDVDGFVRGLLNIYPSYQNDPLNDFDDVKNYTLLNLYTGLRTANGAMEISFFAKNVLKTYRALSVSNIPLQTGIRALQFPSFTTVGQTLGSNYLSVTSLAPREFGINLRYAFGSR